MELCAIEILYIIIIVIIIINIIIIIFIIIIIIFVTRERRKITASCFSFERILPKQRLEVGSKFIDYIGREISFILHS